MRKLKNYVKGAWTTPEAESYLDVKNPSTGDTISRVPLSTADEANWALAAAHEAYPEWGSMPVARRVSFLYRFLQLVQEHEDRVSRVLVEEMGKSLTDARAELKRLIENVQVACGMPVMQQGDKVIGCSFGIDGEVLRLPMGVFTMIAPFNFPAMVPFWFIPYALATGNTYVVKPSEQVPNTMNLIAEYFDEAGFPPGVFNLVNGGPAVAEAFMDSPLVKGMSMVGSTRVCRIIAERCARANKRFQALGSAKNHLVVMPDARIDEVVRNMITSCFGCAGQRCMAASAIVCVGEATYREVTGRFVEAAKSLIVANPLDDRYENEPVLIGPVISRTAKERIEKLIEAGVREGATLALDGRGIKVKGFERGHFIGPTVFTDVKPGMEVHSTEIFGPVVVMLQASTLGEAIAIINDHEYGNGASIYTQNGFYARKFKLETQCGMIGINVGIPAPVAYLPFGGMKSSFFADIKAQGKAIIHFFTEDKIVTERYWPEE
jgi:malonate-semialdehyde dehydrogenase (acetylating)/methylmalonate-semialdehyde dehydrogenase